MWQYSTIVICILFCVKNTQAQNSNLKKLKITTNQTALYKCSIKETYWVDHAADSIKAKEEIRTYVQMDVQQDVLEKKRNFLKIDYNQKQFLRQDTIINLNGNIDTSSNKGKSPIVKIILQYTGKGAYIGPVLEMQSAEYAKRDFRYFFNTAKQLIYPLPDGVVENNKTWTTYHTDTLLNSGFELVFTRSMQWQWHGNIDTLGYKCMRILYNTSPTEYYTVNAVLKALGIESVHKGKASVQGYILVDALTGSVVALYETGSFVGNVEMKTPQETYNWPSEYTYQKSMELDGRIVIKKRKKFLGIF